MTIGVFLSSGESLASFERLGQQSRLEYYLQTYAKHFRTTYLFSYEKRGMHRYIWMVCMPFFRAREFRSCDVYRVLQFPGVLPALIGKLLFQKPILVTYGYRYDEFLALDSAWVKKALLRLLEWCSFPFIDHFLVTTDVLATYLRGRGIDSDRIVKIPNGVDTTHFRPAARRRRKGTTILFVGRLERQKNLLVLVDAFSRLKKKENIRLHIVGPGSMKTQIMKHARRLRVALDVTDVIAQDRLPKVYQNADIFVLPSLNEGQPKVLLEAMSCGLPCIVARFPGVEEIVHHGKNGLIIDATGEEICRFIEKLRRDQSLADTIGRNARETIVRSFDLGKLLAKELTILSELAQ